MTAFANDITPALAARVELRTDPVSGDPILLYPEGILRLNPTAHAILELCNGARKVPEIVSNLGERFEADPFDLKQDVLECLDRLRLHQLIVITTP